MLFLMHHEQGDNMNIKDVIDQITYINEDVVDDEEKENCTN